MRFTDVGNHPAKIHVATVVCNLDGTTTIVPNPNTDLHVEILQPGETYILDVNVRITE